MNLWLDGLPDSVEVEGKSYPIHTDFRIWVRLENLLFWDTVTWQERMAAALCSCYSNEIPSNIQSALQAVMGFYSSNGSEKLQGNILEGSESDVSPSSQSRRIYSFNHDAAFIYAAFRAQYGIDLLNASLHWWQFQALFSGLADENKFCKIMEIRAMDLSTIKDKETKAYYRRMKRAYRLPDPRSEEEKEAAMVEAFARLF